MSQSYHPELQYRIALTMVLFHITGPYQVNLTKYQYNKRLRRSWTRNEGAMRAIEREMERTPLLKVTLPNLVDDHTLDELDI